MATAAASPRQAPAPAHDFLSWLRQMVAVEVAPWPGRVNAVVRMTVAATLVMLVAMTFRIPGAALAGYYALLLTRENLAATWRQGLTFVLAFSAGTVYTLVSMMIVRDYPIIQFFWVIGSLYLMFFVMRTVPDYGAAAGFSFLVAMAIPLWDRSIPVDRQVEGTLWQAAVVAMGAGVTILTEVVYRIFDRTDPVMQSIDDLLGTAETVVRSFALSSRPPEAVSRKAVQYSMVGTGRLRTGLLRQGVAGGRRAHLSALIALSGRLIDLSVNLDHIARQPSPEDARRLRALAERIHQIRAELRWSGVISTPEAEAAERESGAVPVLPELERTVALITQAFHREEEIADPLHELEPQQPYRLFLPDAFSNREHLRFAFAGCMAASLCYILYNALDWPGISTSVATCVITALSNVGTSRQKQVLRISGAIVGGLVIGIPAQILILPNIDGIFGFAAFFAAGTAVAAWFATSSPRLSYFGMQIALAFDIINLQDFAVQTNLTLARDRVIGVLLGIVAMGLVFDQFAPKSAGDEMRQLFLRNLRMLADLVSSPVQRDRRAMIRRVRRLRSRINENFTSLAAQLDAVQFEFGRRRQQHLAIREWMQNAQPAMRSIYLLELGLLQYRGRPDIYAEFTHQQRELLDRFLRNYAASLESMAAGLSQGKAGAWKLPAIESAREVEEALRGHPSPHSLALRRLCHQMAVSLEDLRNVWASADPPAMTA